MSSNKIVLNTNLSSLIVSSNLKTSTKKLNQAIERLTTGAKINHAGDNAANYSIAANLNTKINSLQVAEDNASQGLDMLNTTSSSLEIIEDRLARLRSLQEQAMNGAFGEESLSAINSECNALVDEIERTYASAEYNGISLLQTRFSREEVFANESTTFEQLGIGASSFQIYDSDNNLVEAYDTEAEDSVGEFLGALRTHGFVADINEGKINLSSSDCYYVSGDLATALGISTSSVNVITTTTQSSTAPANYTIHNNATEESTFSQIGVITSGSQNVTIRNADGSYAGNVALNADTTIETFFNRLSGYNITGTITDGVITLNSTDGSYLESGGVVSALGITAYIDSTTTAGRTQTSTLQITMTETITTPETTETTSVETTTTIWTTTTTSETHTETIWTTTTTGSTRTITIGTSQTSTAAIKYESVKTASVSFTQSLQTTMNSLEAAAARVESGGLMSVITKKTSAPSGYTWVTTAAQLQTALNNNQNIMLGANIDMTSVNSTWVMKEGYSGTFDGNGYAIRNFSITSDAEKVGLIASTASGAKLKNIRMENVNVESTESSGLVKVGSLVGSISSSNTISNIAIVSGSVTSVSSISFCAGISGYIDRGCTITNCYNSADISASYITGGIFAITNSEISNCFNSGSVTTNVFDTSIGGIIGFIDSLGAINNCYNTGTITTNGNSSYIGGIAGKIFAISASCYLKNCYNSGNINTTSNYNYAGGIVGGATVGDNQYSLILNCYNTGNITAENNHDKTGGIVGIHNSTNLLYITNCYNSGSVKGYSKAGGIIGQVYYDDCVKITNCINSSSDISPGLNASTKGYGIVGIGSATVTNSYYNNALSYNGGTSTSASDANSRISTGINQTSGSHSHTSTTTVSATSTTKMSQLGLSSNANIVYCKNGVTKTITVKTTDTIDSITYALSIAGFTSSLASNKITITGGDNLYISSFDSTLASKLNLSSSWTTTGVRDYTETTTTSTTNTIETTTTTTTSTTETETIYTTTTIPGTSTTNTIKMTESSIFGNFGLSSDSYITINVGGVDQTITVKTTDTVGTLISALGGANSITASVTDGILSINPQTGAYIKNMSDNLRNLLNMDNSYYDRSYNYSNSNSNTLQATSTELIQGTTSLTDAGVTNGNIKIHNNDGSYSTISISGLVTFDDLIDLLHTNGIELTILDGNITAQADGNVYLQGAGSNLLNILKLGNTVYDYVARCVNKVNGRNTYSDLVENEKYAPDEIVLQVGINSDESSQISVKMGLEWEALNSLRRIGLDKETDFLSRIDGLMSALNIKQAEIGTAQNRLESTIESIGVMYDNLVSTRSTIVDADVAEVSSQMIRQQILQQASATLLATANQTPGLALRLI